MSKQTPINLGVLDAIAPAAPTPSMHPADEMDDLMLATKCPIPWRHMDDPEIPAAVHVAYDAFVSFRPDAMQTLIDLPCTIGIGSDSYTGTVKKVTRTTITVAWSDDRKVQVFRFTKHGWTSGRSYQLCVGFAREHRSPEF